MWQAAVQTGKEVLAEGSEEFGNWKNKCEAAEEVLERLLGSEAEAVEVLLYRREISFYLIQMLYYSRCVIDIVAICVTMCNHARSVYWIQIC